MNGFTISIRTFSVASIIFWVSLLVYLPPFRPMPILFHQDIRTEIMKAYGLLFFGVLSGLLMFYRYKLGRIIALILAVVVICAKVAAMFPNVSQRAYALYVLMLQQSPIMVIHNDVLLPLFMFFTILYVMINKVETPPVY